MAKNGGITPYKKPAYLSIIKRLGGCIETSKRITT
ncbi:hypothetical protein SAMN05216522_12110 [Rosenbergiella nectarea]|uniref:Uncharacterized protein n=1 Tax=Rosenbergiella nectarea TaxID=988801 RepID=A0A1H9N199_9GAMM|nr:hypothetical protein SAMN05216522_12110 [Rosenbergiella nectarea]